MKATIVAGPYGAGKTTLIRNMKPCPETKIFVAESSRLVPDRNRYGIDREKVIGVSFGCVCCPDEELLNQEIKKAAQNRDYKNLIIEPPGNLDSRKIAAVLMKNEIELERVITLVPYPHFQIEKIDPNFISNLQNASVVGVTKAEGNKKPEGLEEMMRELGSTAPIFNIPRENPDLKTIYDSPSWSLERLAGLENSRHHKHYRKYLQGISPALSKEEVLRTLNEIASIGIVRAKGSTHGIDFDIVRGQLEISPSSHSGPGYFVGFDDQSNSEITSLIAMLGPKKGEKIKYSKDDATPSQRLEYFYHLLSQSENLAPSIFGIVQSHFEPLDSAYHLADEILQLDNTDIPMRMVLVPRIKIRIRALKELEKQEKPQKNINARGVELASYIIQHIAVDRGRNFPEMLDASQFREIIRYVIPRYFHHLAHFTKEDRATFSEYPLMQGPYFLNMAERARPFVVGGSVLKKAIENMAGIDADIPLGEKWKRLLILRE